MSVSARARSAGAVTLMLLGLTGDADYSPADRLDESGVVSRFAAPGMGGPQGGGRERLRGLDGQQPGPFQRHQPAVVLALFDRVQKRGRKVRRRPRRCSTAAITAAHICGSPEAGRRRGRHDWAS